MAWGITCFGQTKTWTGAGDGLSWNNAANWSGATLPGPADTVAITGGVGTLVRISSGNITVKSIQCTKGFALLGGSLTLTAGNSQFSGAFAVSNSASLKVNGVGATLTASAMTVNADASLYAVGGGAMYLPNLTSITNNNYNSTFQADGAGSLIDLSAVTNLTLGYYRVLYIQAYNGGTVDLHRLTNAVGSVQVDAHDNGTVVNLSGLAGRWKCTGYSGVSLEAQSGASILIPNVTQLEFASLRVDDTGTISTAQLNLLTNVSLTVSGTAPNFGNITNIDDTDVYALNGGVAWLTNVFRTTHGNQSPVWRADGAGSLIDVSRLANATMSYYKVLYLQAYSGGTVDLHRLTNAVGSVQVYAQDSSTLVDLSGLAGCWKCTGYSAVSLEAQGGASILIPNVTQLEFASLRVDDTGTISTAQLNLLTNVSLTVDGSAPNFGRVTNIDDTSVYALNGGVARLTNVFLATHANQSPVWRADGAGSLVDLSMLTNVSMGYYKVLYLQAYNGGALDLHRLSTAIGSVQVDARDAATVVNLSALCGRWKCTGYSELSLRAQAGASILIPNVTQLEFASLRVEDTGTISTAQLNLLSNVSLTVSGTAPNFGNITNIDDTDVYALNGGVARLTNVFRATHANQSPVWRTDGAGSLVDLSMLTNVTLGYYKVLYPQAYNGGTVDLHRVASAVGSVQVDAQDAGSVVNLSGLAGRWKSTAYSGISLEAQGGASILIPNVTQLEFASLRVDNTGTISTAQLNLLTNVSLTVDGSVPNFGQVTNIDDTDVYALNGGVARLTNVLWVTDGNQSPVWRATGAGSLIDLSGAIDVSVGYYKVLYVEAQSGGAVDLHRLPSLSTSSVQVLADGTSSVVDLTSLSGFISVGYSASSLTAQNNGVILLGTQAFLLANVGINIPPGNPILPATLSASPTLTLYGRPWHSYWIEKRDTRSNLNPWTFATRVPLTTAFQAVAPAPPPNTEFRIWDFTADPPILDLFPATGHQTLMIIYDTPGKTNQLLTATNVKPGTTWQPGATASMTNAFRIMVPTVASDPVRFFRAKRL
jgi:hypothetical protein